jgi:hypothetical protein
MKTFFKIFTFFISIVIVLSFTELEDNPVRMSSQLSPSETMILSSKKMDGNNISTWYSNNGSFNKNPLTSDPGFEWPKTSNKFARYASGIWIGAKVGNDTLLAIAEYSAEFLPGYIDQNGNPQGKDDPLYKIYVIEEGDTVSSDYQNWPSTQGAYLNSTGKPLLLGKQTMFYSYSDGYTESHTSNLGSTAPLKAQILQTNWCYDLPNHLYNIIFTEWRIINVHNLSWTNAYIGLWTDDDIGYAYNDLAGCDSVLNLTYTYDSSDPDPVYGNAPPAVGFMILQGLQYFTGSILDTVSIQNPPGLNLIKKSRFKELKLSSFFPYIKSDPNYGDPRYFRDVYLNLQGLTMNGGQWINPVTNAATKFPFSGDPESGTGWVMTSPKDRRNLCSLGPVTVHPNDTQYLIFAQLIAKGTSNLNSVTKLKEAALIAKRIYDNNFTNVVSVNEQNHNIPKIFTLHQNFPNPFNPSTKIKFDIRQTVNISLKVYDVSGKLISTLIENEKMNAGTREITFDAKEIPSGIYFYTLEAGNFKETKKMIVVK